MNLVGAGRAVVVSLALAVAVGACSGGRGTTVATHDAGSSSPPGAVTDLVAARHTLLSTADLPGYDAIPVPDTLSASLKAASSFQACSGAAAALGDDQRTALSPAFFKGQTLAVSSLAIVAPSEGEARTALADLTRADLGACLSDLFRTVLALDTLPGTTAQTEPLAVPSVSDQSVAWRTTLQVVAGGQSVSAYADLTFFRSSRTVAMLFSFQVGQPFPAGERSKLLAAMAART